MGVPVKDHHPERAYQHNRCKSTNPVSPRRREVIFAATTAIFCGYEAILVKRAEQLARFLSMLVLALHILAARYLLIRSTFQ